MNESGKRTSIEAWDTSSNTTTPGGQVDILKEIATRKAYKQKRKKKRAIVAGLLAVFLLLAAVGVFFLLFKNTYTVKFYVNSELQKEVQVKAGDLLHELDIPTEKLNVTGMEFVGWFLNPMGEGEPFDVLNTKIKEDMHLHARFTSKTVTLQVFLNDGTEDYYNVTGKYSALTNIYNTEEIAKATQNYKENYELVGFDINKDAKIPQHKKDQWVNLYDGKIFLIWEGHAVNIPVASADANTFGDREFETPNLTHLRYGDSYIVNTKDFNNGSIYQQGTGARLEGLYVKVDGVESLKKNGERITIAKGMSFRLAFGKDKHILTIKYDNDLSDDVFYGYQRQIKLPSDITKPNYMLVNYTGFGTVAAGNNVTIEGEMTMTANWSGSVYELMLDSLDAMDGGTDRVFFKYSEGYFISNDTSESNRIQQITIPEKTGHSFLGYFIDDQMIFDSNGALYDYDNMRFEGNATLSAKYEPKLITVTLRNSVSGTVLAINQGGEGNDNSDTYEIYYGNNFDFSIQLNDPYTNSYAAQLMLELRKTHSNVEVVPGSSGGSEINAATVFRVSNLKRDTEIFVPVLSKNIYSVTWINGDTKTTTRHEHGTLPETKDPTKTGNAEIRYEFAGWDKDFEFVVSEGQEYTALYINYITKPALTTRLAYTGQPQNISKDYTYYYISSTNETNAGEYGAEAILKNENDFWADGSTDAIGLTWYIDALKIQEQPYIQFGTHFTYSGTTQTILNSLQQFDANLMQITGDIDAVTYGNYSVTISLKDKTNYRWENYKNIHNEDVVIDWSISKAKLTVEVYSQEIKNHTGEPMIFNGDPKTTKQLSFTGFVPGDNAQNAFGDGTSFAFSGDAVGATDVGVYDIVLEIGTITALNYNIEIRQGAKLTINNNKVTKPTLAYKTYSYTAGDITPTINNFDAQIMIKHENQSSTLTAKNVGKYQIIISLKENQEWGVGGGNADVVLEWEITKYKLRVTAVDQTIIYGDTRQDFSTSYMLIGDDNPATAIAGEFDFSGNAIGASNAGVYDIIPTLGTASSNNYEFDFVAGTLTIMHKKINRPVLINDGEVVYMAGDINAPITGASSDMEIGSGSTLTARSVGNYYVVYTPKPNFQWQEGTAESLPFNWKITKATLTITAKDITFTYGDIKPDLDIIISGFIGEDNKSNQVEGDFGFGGDGVYAQTVGVWDYIPTTGNAVSHNYQFVFVKGKVTIVAIKMLAPSLSPMTYKYDNTNITPHISNFDASAMTKTGDITRRDAGDYFITINLDSNFEWTTGGSGTITLPWNIEKANLTVRPQDYIVEYSDAFPVLDIVYQGFIGTDNAQNSITGAFTVRTDAGQSSGVGNYPITFASTGSAKNYNIKLENGQLNIVTKKLALPVFENGNNQINLEYNAQSMYPTLTNITTGVVLPQEIRQINTGNYQIKIDILNNYEWITGGSSEVTLNWSITKADLQISIKDVYLPFGNDPNDVDFELVYDGFKGTDNSSAIQLDYKITTTANANSPVGEYDITFSSFNVIQSRNYEILPPLKGTFNIEENTNLQKPSLVNKTFTYTGRTIEPSIFNYNDKIMDKFDDTTAKDVGSYKITIKLKSGNTWGDDTTDDIVLDYTIEKANLQVYANNKSFVFGDAVPKFDVRYEGFRGDDNASNSLVGDFLLTSPATSISDVDIYKITLEIGSTTAKNYNIHLHDGSLDLNPKLIVQPTLPLSSFVYTATTIEPAITNYNSSVMNKDAQLVGVDVGTYTMTFALKPNHEWVTGGREEIEREWKITKAPLTVQANNKTVIYEKVNTLPVFDGNPLTSTDFTFYGFRGNDGKSVVKGEFVLTTTAKATDDAGAYQILICAANASADNYELLADAGVFTISPLRIQKPYINTFTYEYTAGELMPVIHNFNSEYMEHTSDSDSKKTNVGDYTIKLRLKKNYDWGDTSTVENIGWHITKAEIFVRPVDKYMVFGGAVPVYSGTPASGDLTFMGFKGSIDSPSSGAITGAFAFAHTVKADSAPGTYPVTASIGTAKSQNYSFRFIEQGSINIQHQSTPIIPTLTDASFKYTGAYITPVVNNFSDVMFIKQGDISKKDVGVYYLVIALKEGYRWQDGTNQPISLKWEITPATLTVKVNNQSRAFNAPNPKPTYDIIGWLGTDATTKPVNGEFILTHTANANSPIGSYVINITSQASSQNYVFELETGILTISDVMLTKPNAKDTEFEYTGWDIVVNLNNFDDNLMTKTGDVAEQVGSYTITIALKDVLNYHWADGTTDSFTITWTITKVNIHVSLRDQTKTYLDPIINFDANPLTTTHLDFSGFEGPDNQFNAISGEFVITSSITNNSIVGSYDINVSIGTASSHNYNFTFEGATYTVTPMIITAPEVAGPDSFVFDNKSHQLNFDGFDANLMNMTDNTGFNSGYYEVIITLKDGHNYNWERGSNNPQYFYWFIDRMTVQRPEFLYDTLIYNGELQEIFIQPGEHYEVFNNRAITPGIYSLFLELKYYDSEADIYNAQWDNGLVTHATYDWFVVRYMPEINEQESVYEYIHGQLLNARQINETVIGVNGIIDGTFEFVNPTHKPSPGITEVECKFTPEDESCYFSISFWLEIIVREIAITFNSNGGSSVAQIVAEYGTSVAAPTAPTKTGYLFDGWYTNSALTTPVVWRYQLLDDVTFYAKWKENLYTVSFSNSNDNGVGAVRYPNNPNIPAIPPTQILEGSYYTFDLNQAPFLGLFQRTTGAAIIGVQINGTGAIYTENIIVSQNIVLTFVFKPLDSADVVTINYNSGGINGTTPEPDTVIMGKGTNITVLNVSKNSYTLLGYATTNVSYENLEGVTLYSLEQLSNMQVGGVGRVTYYAIWAPDN